MVEMVYCEYYSFTGFSGSKEKWTLKVCLSSAFGCIIYEKHLQKVLYSNESWLTKTTTWMQVWHLDFKYLNVSVVFCVCWCRKSLCVFHQPVGCYPDSCWRTVWPAAGNLLLQLLSAIMLPQLLRQPLQLPAIPGDQQKKHSSGYEQQSDSYFKDI